MTYRKKLPIGIDNFEKLIQEDFYYIDKTDMIADLLKNWSEVNLFTRPRRFGKSLNMSMLKTFFEIGCDKKLFQGLKISEEKEICQKYMGQFPVISISLKGGEGRTFDSAKEGLKYIIGNEAMRFQFLTNSEKLSEKEKTAYKRITEMNTNAGAGGLYAMSEDILSASLKTLSGLLEKYYGKKVILLIDEYDVPLDKAFQYGYYEEMVSLIRNILGNVLKTNSSLYFAVLTGCLRISKESIFTGLNNLKVMSITNVQFDEYFGFTDSEVKEMLNYYGLMDHFDSMKAWYDGYRFGLTEIYNPWSVLNCIDSYLQNDMVACEPYWSNTSSNRIVKRLIEESNERTKSMVEELINGTPIHTQIFEDVTYGTIDVNQDYIWSLPAI